MGFFDLNCNNNYIIILHKFSNIFIDSKTMLDNIFSLFLINLNNIIITIKILNNIIYLFIYSIINNFYLIFKTDETIFYNFYIYFPIFSIILLNLLLNNLKFYCSIENSVEKLFEDPMNWIFFSKFKINNFFNNKINDEDKNNNNDDSNDNDNDDDEICNCNELINEGGIDTIEPILINWGDEIPEKFYHNQIIFNNLTKFLDLKLNFKDFNDFLNDFLESCLNLLREFKLELYNNLVKLQELKILDDFDFEYCIDEFYVLLSFIFIQILFLNKLKQINIKSITFTTFSTSNKNPYWLLFEKYIYLVISRIIILSIIIFRDKIYKMYRKWRRKLRLKFKLKLNLIFRTNRKLFWKLWYLYWKYALVRDKLFYFFKNYWIIFLFSFLFYLLLKYYLWDKRLIIVKKLKVITLNFLNFICKKIDFLVIFFKFIYKKYNNSYYIFFYYYTYSYIIFLKKIKLILNNNRNRIIIIFHYFFFFLKKIFLNLLIFELIIYYYCYYNKIFAISYIIFFLIKIILNKKYTNFFYNKIIIYFYFKLFPYLQDFREEKIFYIIIKKINFSFRKITYLNIFTINMVFNLYYYIVFMFFFKRFFFF